MAKKISWAELEPMKHGNRRWDSRGYDFRILERLLGGKPCGFRLVLCDADSGVKSKNHSDDGFPWWDFATVKDAQDFAQTLAPRLEGR